MLKRVFHYHLGLTLFSLFPGIILFFLVHSILWGLSVVFLINLLGLLRLNHFISLSFYSLKPIYKFLGSDGFAAEEMAIALGTGKTIKSWENKLSPEKILLLLPHCLQRNDCNRRITNNTNNCIRCGRCPIGELLDLADKTGVKIAIATGGTLARRYIKETRPETVVAVACPRDLGQGMIDATPVPIVGVLNSRPNGDCFDTQVDIKAVELAIKKLLNSKG